MIGEKYILDENGEPVLCDDLMSWGGWYVTADKRRVAANRINGIYISTVFLGLDHAFDDGPPVLWETMIFGGSQDQETWRYTSREAAARNHAAILRRIRLRCGKKHQHWKDQQARDEGHKHG